MKKEITLKEAIDGVRGLFSVKPYNDHEDGESFMGIEDNGEVTFYFDKRQYLRDEVINRLVGYFSDKVITDGQCRIDNITLVWTTVHLEKR